MSNKSHNSHEICRASAFNGTSNNELFRACYSEINHHISNSFSEAIPKALQIEELKNVAEQEFVNQYNTAPSCVVFAPECLTIAGESKDLPESKSLCMAVEPVTVIAGKPSRHSKLCQVKMFLSLDAISRTFVCEADATHIPTEGAEETSWARCTREILRWFKAKQGYFPGFKSVIVSGMRSKCNTECSSSLVVAIYTFLEVITGQCTSNLFEKALVCHLVEKRVKGSYDSRFANTLTTVLASKNTVFLFDARSLSIEQCTWDTDQVNLALIDVDDQIDQFPGSSSNRTEHKAVAVALSTCSYWYTRPIDESLMKRLFTDQVASSVKRAFREDDRTSRTMELIKIRRWKELGKLFWESCRAMRKCGCSMPSGVEHILTVLKTVQGVLGAKIISRDYGASSILVLVQRSCLKTFVLTLNRIKSSRHRYRIVGPSIGATALYTHEICSASGTKKQYSHSKKFKAKHHIREGYDFNSKYHNEYEPAKSLSLFTQYDSLVN